MACFFTVTIIGDRIGIGGSVLSPLTYQGVHFLTVPTLGDNPGLSLRPGGIYLPCPGTQFCLSTDSNSEHLKDNLVSEFSCYLQSSRHLGDSVKELRKFKDKSSVIHLAFPEYLLCAGLRAKSCGREVHG